MDTCCWICYFNENTDLRPLEALLPPERLAQLEKKHPRHRAHSLLAEALLRKKLAEYTGISPRQLELRRDETGRPLCSLAQVSLSHTDGAAAAAFSSDPIGIDIERHRPGRLRAAGAFFSEGELQAAQRSPQVLFWEMWTRKEALAKALNLGLDRQLAQMDTLSPPLSDRLSTQTESGFSCSVYTQGPFSLFRLTAGELMALL